MRHDYQLPGDWPSMTDDEKDRWFKQERARRQHIQQRTPTTKELSRKHTRHQRKLSANGFKMLSDKR